MPTTIGGIIKGIDKGFYREAKRDDCRVNGYQAISDAAMKAGIYPDQATIDNRVKRLLFKIGCKNIDPNALSPGMLNKVEMHAIETYALDMALSDQGICSKGAGADRIEKFFTTTTSAVLFPAWLDSQIQLGMLAISILPALVAAETFIDSDTYKGLKFTDVEDDQQLREVGQGENIPVTKITTADTVVTVKKFARILEASYEAIRRQKIDVFAIMLQRIGRRIALDETNWAIETLISGDGNTGSNLTHSDVATSGKLLYSDLTTFYGTFPVGYQMTDAVCNWAQINNILNMAEFKDPMAGFRFQSTGELPGPLGATWHRWDSLNAPSFGSGYILAVDSRVALQQITELSVMSEADRLIDRDIERTKVEKVTGFYKLDYNAVKMLHIS